jgi:hypothetical protein
MQTTDKIYVAGHRGRVGSALMHEVNIWGFGNLFTVR